jgi:hypothetical protein
MNKNEAFLFDILTKLSFTPARVFNPKIKGRIPDGKVYDILKGMQEKGLAELAYGRGWRAIETEPTGDPLEAELYQEWKVDVAAGDTILGFQEWVINNALADGWDPSATGAE